MLGFQIEGPLRNKYNGPSKDIKIKDPTNIMNMRKIESYFSKTKIYGKRVSQAECYDPPPTGL